MLGERRQVWKDLRAFGEIALLTRLSSLAGEHQHRARAGSGGGLDVLSCVAHHVDILQRDVEAPRHLEEHARLRLAAFAAGVRRVLAEEKRIDPAAHLPERTLRGLVDGEKRARRKEAA